ncbi:FAD:protein FMN transferase [Massilia sp. TS11]|uniref:FAD:protein FMN transferase n=1 Tax=Massilia sp. TS11 TaxID=2908003 RepID=UPI001EDA001E|nr:FAD:protein FMN transferase [Massilia sp. TS11]MCG2583762.1 FAD:protein FMN transferase [Massilia sp. TS11]
MQVYRLPFRAMGSVCEVVLAAADEASANAHGGAAIAEVQRIEAKYSRYRDDSIIARLNAGAGGAPISCDAETLALLDFAQQLYRESGGLFDITSGVLRKAWDFRQRCVPAPGALAACVAAIGWARVERDGAQVRLPQAGMELDFGGFGKEYAADRGGEQLLAQGVRHGYVNLAGDIRVIGPKPDGSPWTIGIQHPRRQDAMLAAIPLLQGALATSGDYERFIEVGGQRHCHILDPRTGHSVRYWRSVSVLAPQAIVAGAVSTIAMLQQESGLDFLRASGFDFLAMDHSGALYRAGPAPSQTHPA